MDYITSRNRLHVIVQAAIHINGLVIGDVSAYGLRRVYLTNPPSSHLAEPHEPLAPIGPQHRVSINARERADGVKVARAYPSLIASMSVVMQPADENRTPQVQIGIYHLSAPARSRNSVSAA